MKESEINIGIISNDARIAYGVIINKSANEIYNGKPTEIKLIIHRNGLGHIFKFVKQSIGKSMIEKQNE